MTVEIKYGDTISEDCIPQNPRPWEISQGCGELGNPTTYYNGEDTYNFTWENGRQLSKTITTLDERTVTYTYNKDGIRTGKKVEDGVYLCDSYEMT